MTRASESPGLAAFFRAGEVVPKDVDLAVVREQLTRLAVEVLGVLRLVASLFLLAEGLVLTLGMDVVDHEFRMMPIDHGVVETDLETLGAERVDPLPEQVTTDRGVRHLVIGQLRIPEAESLMML